MLTAQLNSHLMVILFLALRTKVAEASSENTHMGCFTKVPPSYVDQGTYSFQSSSYCSGECSDYVYFALFNGNECFCGNVEPSDSIDSSFCNSGCYGYDLETCGGTSYFDIYSIDGATANTASKTATATSATGMSSNAGTAATSGTAKTTATTTAAGGSTIVVTTVAGGTTSTVENTATASSSGDESKNDSSSSSSGSKSSSDSNDDSSSSNIIGPAVGGALGGLAVVGVLATIAFFYIRRREKRREKALMADSAYFGTLKRDGSIVTQNGVMGGAPNRPLENPFLGKEEQRHDDRLNPVMLGRRRLSEGSLADEADYSRKILRVANPDDAL